MILERFRRCPFKRRRHWWYKQQCTCLFQQNLAKTRARRCSSKPPRTSTTTSALCAAPYPSSITPASQSRDPAMCGAARLAWLILHRYSPFNANLDVTAASTPWHGTGAATMVVRSLVNFCEKVGFGIHHPQRWMRHQSRRSATLSSSEFSLGSFFAIKVFRNTFCTKALCSDLRKQLTQHATKPDFF